VSAAAIALAIVAMLVGAARAAASEPLSNTNVKNIHLAVNARGEALVTYTTQAGTIRHVLIWGAINALAPDAAVRQVRFKYDYSGGWKSRHNPNYWKTIKGCGPYDGPMLQFVVVACKAPDGTYWALQAWQRALPLLGFSPWRPAQTAWEGHVSHWSGDLPILNVAVHKTYNGSAVGVFGQFLYEGKPVYGFKSTAEGNPLGRYERNVYIDTHDSVYGAGWFRESGILTHNPTGTFCHSFVPQRPFPGYPSTAMRPPAPGDQYRFTIMGPGVTPVIQKAILGTPADASIYWNAWMTGDRKCAPEK